MINQLFFEIIRVAIGTQDRLSRLPLANEWDKMYEIAKKQSLVGICFVAIQRLGADADEGFARIGMSEDTYFNWMGIAARIQARNGLLNQQCAIVQGELGKAGFESCILKGQAVAALYGELAAFRQSGDIDVWMPGTTIPQLVEYLKGLGTEYDATYAHVSFKPFSSKVGSGTVTEVELHPRPAFLRNFWNNRKLQKWFRSFDMSAFEKTNGFTTPTIEFNLVYLLLHMYHHVLYEGVGLRQLMDYYFVLKARNNDDDNVLRIIDKLGMKRFAQGVMYIMQSVFGLSDDKLLFEPNPEIGQLLLSEVMAGGNFGHHDTRYKELQSQKLFVKGWGRLQKKWHFTSFALWDILCSPFWSLWQITWRKVHGYY